MSVILGLTGPTGSGKSSVAVLAAKRGITIVDCDRLARKAVKPGTKGLCALTAAFGKGILCPDGSLDRAALAALAFSSPEQTELLNRTVLPHIAELVLAEAHGEQVLIDAPTLFESGLDSICDVTVAVLADKEQRAQRIIKRDRLTLKEADTRISAGKPDGYYIGKAGHILYNNGDMLKFDTEVSALLDRIFGGNANV